MKWDDLAIGPAGNSIRWREKNVAGKVFMRTNWCEIQVKTLEEEEEKEAEVHFTNRNSNKKSSLFNCAETWFYAFLLKSESINLLALWRL